LSLYQIAAEVGISSRFDMFGMIIMMILLIEVAPPNYPSIIAIAHPKLPEISALRGATRYRLPSNSRHGFNVTSSPFCTTTTFDRCGTISWAPSFHAQKSTRFCPALSLKMQLCSTSLHFSDYKRDLHFFRKTVRCKRHALILE
jgi:hypothetical protein